MHRKRQLYEDALHHNKFVKSIKFDENTKKNPSRTKMYFYFLMILPGVIDCEANTQISMKIFKVLKCSVDRFSKGNLIVSVMVFFSINTFEKIARYFDIADVQ